MRTRQSWIVLAASGLAGCSEVLGFDAYLSGASSTSGSASGGGMTTSVSSTGGGGTGGSGGAGTGAASTSTGSTGTGGDATGGSSTGGAALTPWVLQFGGPGEDHGMAVASTPTGVIAGGSFSAVALLPGAEVTASDIEPDAFVFRVTSDKTVSSLAWFGTNDGLPSHQVVTAVAANGLGEACIAGYFTHAVKLGAVSLTSSGATDIFVAKLGANGQILWARSFGSDGTDAATAVALLPSGEVVVAGLVDKTVTFDGQAPPSHGGSDGFVARLHAATGAVQWVSRFGSPGNDLAADMAVDKNGDVVVVGAYEGNLTFDGGPTLPISGGGTDAFAVRFNPKGEVIWIRGWGDGQAQRALAVALDPMVSNSPIYVGGEFLGSIVFEVRHLSEAGAPEVPDFFVARLQGKDGSSEWARPFADFGSQDLTEVGLATANGQVVVAGRLQNGADFGKGPIVAMQLDAFVMELTDLGNYKGNHLVTGPGNQRARDVAFGPTLEVYVAGDAEGDPLFDGKAYLPAQAVDGFLMKIPF